jgi:hypothetical protein
VGWKLIPDYVHVPVSDYDGSLDHDFSGSFFFHFGLFSWISFFFAPATAPDERTVAGFPREPSLLFVGARPDVDFEEKQQGWRRCWSATYIEGVGMEVDGSGKSREGLEIACHVIPRPRLVFVVRYDPCLVSRLFTFYNYLGPDY